MHRPAVPAPRRLVGTDTRHEKPSPIRTREAVSDPQRLADSDDTVSSSLIAAGEAARPASRCADSEGGGGAIGGRGRPWSSTKATCASGGDSDTPSHLYRFSASRVRKFTVAGATCASGGDSDTPSHLICRHEELRRRLPQQGAQRGGRPWLGEAPRLPRRAARRAGTLLRRCPDVARAAAARRAAASLCAREGRIRERLGNSAAPGGRVSRVRV